MTDIRSLPDKFETGNQPCENFVAQMDGNEYATWKNVHECYAPFDGNPTCKKTVSFCLNCNRDHHEDGYDNCAGRNT